MPPNTTIAQFNQARITGITKTTQVLEATFELKNPDDVNNLRTQPPIVNLPAWLETALQRPGLTNPALVLSPTELAHISSWPDGLKERVRTAMLYALDTNRSLRFVWRMYDGPSEDTIVQDPGQGNIIATFFSPWSRLRAVGPDDIEITVPAPS